MKALIFDQPNRPVVAEVQSPSLAPDEVMVRSRRVGICHSDYELLAGRYIIPISYPLTPRHELVGEVVEVGRDVKGFGVGDRVVGECVIRTPERIHHFGFGGVDGRFGGSQLRFGRCDRRCRAAFGRPIVVEHLLRDRVAGR